ncbi:50S ribosomal protein L29 [Candidatus Dependentiae bacterium]|nr:50S ribosomal protein L29 [Candidatus Dependentiae bacterium]
MVNMNELNNLDVSALEQKAKSLKNELFTLKFSKLTGQVKDTSLHRKLRVAIAQTLTVLKVKQNLAGPSKIK